MNCFLCSKASNAFLHSTASLHKAVAPTQGENRGNAGSRKMSPSRAALEATSLWKMCFICLDVCMYLPHLCHLVPKWIQHLLIFSGGNYFSFFAAFKFQTVAHCHLLDFREFYRWEKSCGHSSGVLCMLLSTRYCFKSRAIFRHFLPFSFM